jgi:hypothetical protein
VTTHDLKSCVAITDNGDVSDMVDDLLEAVETARASKTAHERDHQRVIDLLVEVRRQRGGELGIGELEEMIGKYMDRATISRKTTPRLGGKPPRKRTRRVSRS